MLFHVDKVFNVKEIHRFPAFVVGKAYKIKFEYTKRNHTPLFLSHTTESFLCEGIYCGEENGRLFFLYMDNCFTNANVLFVNANVLTGLIGAASIKKLLQDENFFTIDKETLRLWSQDENKNLEESNSNYSSAFFMTEQDFTDEHSLPVVTEKIYTMKKTLFEDLSKDAAIHLVRVGETLRTTTYAKENVTVEDKGIRFSDGFTIPIEDFVSEKATISKNVINIYEGDNNE